MSRTLRLVALVAGAVVALAAQAMPPALAGGQQPPVRAQAESSPERLPAVAPEDRTNLLGASYSSSSDRAWTTTGDADGFHFLVADEKSGYSWRNAATLREPGFDTDAWIGNACVTASGTRAIVVYGPRTFTNTPALFARGGFTAVVELGTGKVTKLPLQASLAYYNPGCGAGETAVLTQSGGEDRAATRLVQVNAATAKVTTRTELEGQVTSAVPVGAGVIAAADSSRIIRITKDGRRSVLAAADSVPYGLRADGDGAVVFLDRSSENATVHRVSTTSRPKGARAKTPALATGKVMDVGLTAAANGTVFISGKLKKVGNLPKTVRALGLDREAQVSTKGASAVLTTRWADGKDSRIESPEGGSRPVDIDLRALDTGKTLGFRVEPTAAPSKYVGQGALLSPALGSSATKATSKATTKAATQAAAAGSPTSVVEGEDERYCSVPRNDPRNQAMQPKPRQVEWAVDQAITNNLNSLISRPANWKNLGMPAYKPQTLFPRPDPVGGGRVPAQVMLGIAAQESNLWQASRFTVPGVTGNPLIGNFYGVNVYNDTRADDWSIDWADADCGYGITQVTDHMRLAGKEKNDADAAWAYQTQRAVALDYTVNIAAGLRILVDKWNQTRNAGLIINNGNIAKPENWFFAIWAYNSGLHPKSEASKNGGAWGVGWANNPANPEYPANRGPFMEFTYADAAHPQDWPYPEKVLGFAGHPPELMESPGTYVAAYRAAWWNGTETTGPINRQQVKPPVNQFCDNTNQCVPGQSNTPNAPEVAGSKAGPCGHKNAAGQFDLKCWYNRPSTWKPDCATTCGNELLRFDASYAEQSDGTAYPPNCTMAGLPPGTLVIDESTDPSVRPGCSGVTQSGTFTWTFASDAAGLYPSKMDIHQIGAGFGGHFYFGHSRTAEREGGKLEATGTWRLGATQRNKWARIMVHLPDHGAHTQQAAYKIDLGSGTFTQTRYINQKRKANNWVSLGVYKLNGNPRVQLSTQTDDGTGDEDVAFDAVAFQPLPAKPKHIVAVLGDSYTSGEGVGNYLPETDTDHGTSRWNACRRSKDAWGRRIVLPGTNGALGTKADNFDTDVELGFVACSGAMTGNVRGASFGSGEQKFREGQFNEQKQVMSGVLTADTTLVMLTLGGNDGGGFSGAMKECAAIIKMCEEDPSFLPRYKGKVDNMIGELDATLREIAANAPKAQIVLMGYPELLSRTVKCDGSLWFYMPEVAALATLVNYANDKQKTMVDALRTGTSKLKVEYANPVADFVGHAGCDDPEWIHKIVVGPEGDGDFHQGDPVTQEYGSCIHDWLPGHCLSRASFHLKKDGTGDPGYAGVMRQRLVAIGYTGS